MKNSIQIAFLYDYPNFIEEVASIWHEEWGTNDNENDLSRKLISVRKKANKGKVPFILIAMINDELAGSASLFEKDLKNRPEISPWLAAVVTKRQFRGLGIAEKLTDAVVEESKKLGYKRIYLRTEKADGYFKRLGWTLLEDTVDERAQPTRVYFKEI